MSNVSDVQYANFDAFVKENPSWKEELGVKQRDSATYQRILCIWDERKLCYDEHDDKYYPAIDPETQKPYPVLHHEYYATINTKTGDLYFDCRKRKIMAKHLSLLIGRPIHACVKTLWHASIIAPLACELFKLAKGKQVGKEIVEYTWQEVAKHTWQSLQDIVRTPLYGLAMTATSLAGVLLGCIAPNTLYKTREIAGRLERAMLRIDDIHDEYPRLWLLTPCFNPISNLFKDRGKHMEFSKSAVRHHLIDFAHTRVNNRRSCRTIFNDCGRLLPWNGKAYKSAALPSE